MINDTVIWEGDTELDHYQVVDTLYSGRRARVLFSGDHRAAQSGIAQDGKDELLFDYNERFMELIRGVEPKRILLIGGGAFTLPMAILEQSPGTSIDIVEKDGGLQKIAEDYFGLEPDPRIKIIVGDGRKYLDTTAERYDLIIIDAFTHLQIPRSLLTIEAAAAVERCLLPTGMVTMNVIAAYEGLRATLLRQLLAAYRRVLPQLEVYPAGRLISTWMPQNLVIVASRDGKTVQPYMRFSALSLASQIEEQHPLHDEVADNA